MLGLTNTLKKTAEGYPQYRTRTACSMEGGDGEYITTGGHADFQLNGVDFSISGWIKFTADATSTTNEDGKVILEMEDDDGNGVYIAYLDESGDDEWFRVYHKWNDGSNSITWSARGNDIDHGEWYNFTYTYDVSALTGRIYVDGTQAGIRTSMTSPGDFTTAHDILIGNGPSSNDNALIKVCEIGYWKGVCLSASQVTSIYNNGRPRNLLGVEREYLKGYWRLNAKDDTGSNNVIDYSGAGHHGTTATSGTNDLADSDFDTTDVPT